MCIRASALFPVLVMRPYTKEIKEKELIWPHKDWELSAARLCAGSTCLSPQITKKLKRDRDSDNVPAHSSENGRLLSMRLRTHSLSLFLFLSLTGAHTLKIALRRL